MKILITGASGMLAQAVREKFARDEGAEIVLTDLSGKKIGESADTRAPKEEVQSNGNNKVDSLFLDITDPEGIEEVFEQVCPVVVINCAAYTAVDKAETQEELAYKINADGPGNLARACKELGDSERWKMMAADGEVPEGGPVLVHISTDYVFDGSKPISEDYAEDDEKAPETAYGRTKLAGEEQIEESGCNYYIFRTAWLYGHGGKNFIETMISLSKEHDEISVINDQHGSPTYTNDLTDIIYQAVTNHIPYGIYNATNLGFTTWYDFTREIFRLKNIDTKVKPISSEEYNALAKRPLNSKMSKNKLLNAGIKIPSWQDGLRRYLDEK